MMKIRLRTSPIRECKRLFYGEEIYTPLSSPRADAHDTNRVILCGTCKADLLVSSLKYDRLDKNKIATVIFCSPICKAHIYMKDRDPDKCWITTRPSFVFDHAMFSIRALNYEIHYKEKVPANSLKSLCGSRLCANPLHLAKKTVTKNIAW